MVFSYKEQITAIGLEYEKEKTKEPPVVPAPQTAPEPIEAPSPKAIKQPKSVHEPEVKVVYVDRIVEVPVEVPVYIEVEKPSVADALPPEKPEQAVVQEQTRPLNEDMEHRMDLIPPSTSSDGKKKKNKKNESQRSFGLKLALNQN